MSKPQLKIIETEDGSHSLYRVDLKETYHSFHGARGESMHVFIESAFSTVTKPEVNVLEVGMGTGLNVFLTAIQSKKESKKVRFETIEPLPVEAEIFQNLNYAGDSEEEEILRKIHESSWDNPVAITPYFELIKKQQTLESVHLHPNFFDVVYFDAFAPSKQPEVWAIENLEKCFSALAPGGIMTTYCAQGQFKRNLKAAGFEVESLPGAMGKKEMVRARKPA
jgi:tRNA U34 5-methylaminomethyl-2-thiouridine-forming methyltransferase MnmC